MYAHEWNHACIVIDAYIDNYANPVGKRSEEEEHLMLVLLKKIIKNTRQMSLRFTDKKGSSNEVHINDFAIVQVKFQRC